MDSNSFSAKLVQDRIVFCPEVFADSPGVAPPDLHAVPVESSAAQPMLSITHVQEWEVYANSTRAVLRRHAAEVLEMLLQAGADLSERGVLP